MLPAKYHHISTKTSCRPHSACMRTSANTDKSSATRCEGCSPSCVYVCFALLFTVRLILSGGVTTPRLLSFIPFATPLSLTHSSLSLAATHTHTSQNLFRRFVSPTTVCVLRTSVCVLVSVYKVLTFVNRLI